MSFSKVYFIYFFQIILGLFLEYKFSKYNIMILFNVLASILTSSFSNIVLIWMLPLSLSHPTPFFLSLSFSQFSQRFINFNVFGTDSQVRMDPMKSLPKPVCGRFCCVSISVQVPEVEERPCPAGASSFLSQFLCFCSHSSS